MSDNEDGDDSDEVPPLTDTEVAEKTGATMAEVKEYREIFQLVDLDGGGSIDGEELGELMDLLGMNATKDEVNSMLNEIDNTGTGEVYFQDFVAEMSKKVDCSYSPHEVIKSFQKFAGVDANGMINARVLETTLCSFEGKMAKEEAQDLVAQVPQDKNGMINFVEYVSMMMSDQSRDAQG